MAAGLGAGLAAGLGVVLAAGLGAGLTAAAGAAAGAAGTADGACLVAAGRTPAGVGISRKNRKKSLSGVRTMRCSPLEKTSR